MAERKQFAPTRRRSEDARKKGKVLKSQLLTQAISLGVGMVLISLTIRLPWVRSELLINYALVDSDPLVLALHYLKVIFFGVCGVLLPVVVTAVVVEGWQVGYRFDASILAFQPNRLNPTSGFGKVVQGLKQSWYPLLKFLALFAFSLSVSYSTLPKLVVSIIGSPESRLALMWSSLILVVIGGVLVLLLLSGIDYALKQREYSTELSMNACEMRQEHRESEGDPHIKAARRMQHRQLSTEEIVRRVRSSRVLVVETLKR